MSGQRRTGFTIVELLIVIVVIAILAAIITVAYNGVTRSARTSAAKHDVQTAQIAIENSKTLNGNYPANIATVNNNKGLDLSGQNQALYMRTDSSYCITTINPDDASIMYYSGSKTPQLSQGICPTTVTTIAAAWRQVVAVAVDAQGNTYENSGVSTVIKTTPAGVVTTLAGSATTGYTNASGIAATFTSIRGLAVDQATNVVYVAESAGNCIRKILPDGTVSTIAGVCGAAGAFTDDAGSAARFNSPNGMVTDVTGNVYIVDRGNNRIRKMTPGGVVSTVASGVSAVSDVAVDSTGALYVVTTAAGNNKVYKIVGGVASVLAGSGAAGFADGQGETAQFNLPSGVAVDESGNVFVADRVNNRIRVITPGGYVSTLAGTGVSGMADGVGSSATFGQPLQIRIQPGDSGAMYGVEWNSVIVRKITLQ